MQGSNELDRSPSIRHVSRSNNWLPKEIDAVREYTSSSSTSVVNVLWYYPKSSSVLGGCHLVKSARLQLFSGSLMHIP
uniref:Uncharacterized protein n=1 Tax=Setaria italica TaxID=4555 RepID=K3Y0J1_SETIT